MHQPAPAGITGRPYLPRWAAVSGVALCAVVAFQFWLIADWRALALERASVDTAARSICGRTLGVAEQQAVLLQEVMGQAQQAVRDLGVCKLETLTAPAGATP